MWFTIKAHSKFTSGPRHLFQKLQLVKGQPLHVQTVVKPHIQRNAYFAEPSIMLTSMLEDTQEEIRQFGVNLIENSRQKPPRPPKRKVLKGIRKHEVPPLNWEAKTWKDLIDWKSITVWEPRIFQKISLEQIQDAVQTPIIFPKYPCHSQTVERTVKLVTECSSAVYGEENQRGKIMAVLASRGSRKAYDTKKDYVVN